MLRIKALRLARGLSQWELSRSADMSQGRYGMVERGQIQPMPEEREALARALGAPAATLFRKVFRDRPRRTELATLQK